MRGYTTHFPQFFSLFGGLMMYLVMLQVAFFWETQLILSLPPTQLFC
jgi:hypothetical protein